MIFTSSLWTSGLAPLRKAGTPSDKKLGFIKATTVIWPFYAQNKKTSSPVQQLKYYNILFYVLPV